MKGVRCCFGCGVRGRGRAARKPESNDGQSVDSNHAGNFVNTLGAPKATIRRIGLGRRELGRCNPMNTAGFSAIYARIIATECKSRWIGC